MDPQTQTILLSVLGGIVIASVVAFVWSSIRSVRTMAKRKFNPQRQAPEVDSGRKRGCGCECPPHDPNQCIAARISVPDRTPVAIFGVRTDGSYDDGRLAQSQVQSIVDRAAQLRELQRQDELDELLGKLGRKTTA